MGSILHITSQLNSERTYLHPEAVFNLIERGEAVPLGELGEQKWAVPHAITIVENDDEHDANRRTPPRPSTRTERGSSASWDGSARPRVAVS
jgi:hypothetical protein